jgi:hypothetical protein
MKKAILFFAFVLGLSFAAQAQCSGSKASTGTAAAACCSKAKASTASADAVKATGADVEQRTNAAGEVSYVRKMVNAETGAVSFKAVEYCTKTNQFVDVADASGAAPAAAAGSASGSSKASCASGEAKAGCCSKAGAAEATTSKKGKKAKA